MTTERGDEVGEFVLVPREPTKEMIQASFDSMKPYKFRELTKRNKVKTRWAAMLAASPAPTGAGEAEKLAGGFANLTAILDDQPFGNNVLSVSEIKTILENQGGFMPDEAVSWFRVFRSRPSIIEGDAVPRAQPPQPTGDVEGLVDSSVLVIWAADLAERHLSDRRRWKDYIEDVKLIAGRCAARADSRLAAMVETSAGRINGADKLTDAGKVDGLRLAREIACRNWQSAVKDFDLKPGSKIEEVFGYLLNDLDSVRAALSTGAGEEK